MSNRFPITPIGLANLGAELHHLKTVERSSVIAAIAEARAHGDLSENAEYSAAKEKQGFIEAKIEDLESKISRAQVIDITAIVSDSVQFGATVTLENEETGERSVYKIVSEYEADVEKNHVSIASPLARSMIGKKVGDSMEVTLPKGTKYYQLLKLEFI